LYFFFASRSGNGLVAVLSFFYQVVDLIFVQNNKSSIVLHTLSSLSNLRMSGGTSATAYLCIWHNLDFKDVQFIFMLGTLISLVVPWLTILFLIPLYRCCSRRCRSAGSSFFTSQESLIENQGANRAVLGRFWATLQCVSIPGLKGLFLFGDASVECFSDWQKPVFGVVVVAAVFPVFLFVWVWRHRGEDLSESPTRSFTYQVCVLN
jgi:hypothetical protein